MRYNSNSTDLLEIPLTAKTILQRTSHEEIFRHYCRITPQVGVLFCSQLRADKNPTCSFFSSRGKIKYKDFATGEVFDSFDYVKELYSCTYHEALVFIDRDLNLGIYKSNYPQKKIDIVTPDRVVQTKGRGDKIKVTLRNFDSTDVKYWTSYGLTGETLLDFNVKAVEKVYYGDKVISTSSSSEPIYAYYFPKTDRLKVYSPFSKKLKWIGNVLQSDIYGEHLFTPGDHLIITSSGKDAMVLYQLGYNVIAPQGEGQAFDGKIINMMSWVDQTYILFDNDTPGKLSAQKHLESSPGIVPIYIPEDGKAKDPSDYAQLYGIEELNSFIKQNLV